jgi:hypothetical protein
VRHPDGKPCPLNKILNLSLNCSSGDGINTFFAKLSEAAKILGVLLTSMELAGCLITTMLRLTQPENADVSRYIGIG